EYLAFQFPLTKKLGVSVGFKPVSYAGYRYGKVDSLKHLSGVTQSVYTGSGGLNKIYGTISYQLHPRLAVGANIGYLFGNVMHNSQNAPIVTGLESFYATKTDTLHSSRIIYELGLQYIHSLEKNRNIVIGAVFSPKMNINATVNTGIIRVDPTSGIVQSNPEYATINDLKFELPETYGLGFTFNEKNKWTAGLDIQYLRWASARFYNQTDTLSNQLKINLGGEYTPDYRSNNFFKRMRYRAGLNYADSYIKIAGKGYKEYSAALGFGIPMNDRRSFLNLTFDYTNLRPETESVSAGKPSTFMSEQYFKITVSYTFNELWFFKRKVQ
ncbi:MAG: outer membrane protein transport protein, partial [Candidatus Symbiothrix sp.]|nr:outer membrane protein transport protein [Candidatus Symbiothrix sp.]